MKKLQPIIMLPTEMKNIIFILLFSLIGLVSCTDDKPIPTPQLPCTDYYMIVQIDNNVWTNGCDDVYATVSIKAAKETYNINAVDNSNNKLISITIDTARVATFKAINEVFIYGEDDIYNNNYYPISGTITIEEKTDKYIRGYFDVLVSQQEKDTISLVGEFKAKIK